MTDVTAHNHAAEQQQITAAAGKKLRSLRAQQHLHQDELGAAIGVNGDALLRIETGARALRFAEAVLLARRLGVDVADLVTACSTCGGNPPKGFACVHCGATSDPTSIPGWHTAPTRDEYEDEDEETAP